MDLFDDAIQVPLVIIGNGFDLHHGLDTGYADFKKYLIQNGKANFVSQMESFFQSEYYDEKEGKHKFLLWSNLEAAIGEYGIDYLYHELTDWIEVDFDHMMQSAAQYEDSPNDFLAPVMEDLPLVMNSWISQISLQRLAPIVDLPREARFLTFNYTTVLEDVYHFPNDRILHIHGIVNGMDELVVGHRVYTDESDAFEEGVPIFQDEAKRNIIKIMNERRKPTEEIISRNRSFFKSLQDTTDVYVYGHSYSMVDKDYYEEIRNNVGPETKWHLGCHDDKARAAAESLMGALGISKEYWGGFDF